MFGMAGRPSRKQGALISRHLCNAFREQVGVSLEFLGQALPEITIGMVELAKGVYREEITTTAEGEVKIRVYKQPSDFRAANYIMNRFYGAPRTEASESEERLRAAQAEYMERQIKADIPEAQALEIRSRAEEKMMYVKAWPGQYVTEEKQQEMIRTLAGVSNRALSSITPEQFEEIVKGKDWSEALEAFKGVVGQREADIIEEVLEELGSEDEEDDDE